MRCTDCGKRFPHYPSGAHRDVDGRIVCHECELREIRAIEANLVYLQSMGRIKI